MYVIYSIRGALLTPLCVCVLCLCVCLCIYYVRETIEIKIAHCSLVHQQLTKRDKTLESEQQTLTQR